MTLYAKTSRPKEPLSKSVSQLARLSSSSAVDQLRQYWRPAVGNCRPLTSTSQRRADDGGETRKSRLLIVRSGNAARGATVFNGSRGAAERCASSTATYGTRSQRSQASKAAS